MIRWLSELPKAVNQFISNISVNNYSYFKYSYSGDIYNESTHWGLANTVFAVKILYITNNLNHLTLNQKENMIRSIKSFEHAGMIYDPVISGDSYSNKIKRLLGLIPKSQLATLHDIRRAETRQAFASLYLFKRKPDSPYAKIPYSVDAIESYLESFEWSVPWNAASHFSHLLFFLWYNKNVLYYEQRDTDRLIFSAIRWLSKIQSKEDGCWYIGSNIPLSQKINGAMKVLTGYHSAQIYDIAYPKLLIDTALKGINDTEACSNFNISYLLFGASKIEPNYRRSEIEDFMYKRLEIYKNYFWPDYGGFSFYPGKANDVFYNKKITYGYSEPDIHGTNMFILGIAIINQVLNLGLDWKIPLS